MQKYEILEVITEWVQQKYGPLTETFLANFGDMFELLAEDVPIPWPQYYFLLDKKLLIVLEEDWRFVFLVLECLDFLNERYGSEGLKSRRIILKYLMDFWKEFCQYIADLTSKTKDKFPEPPRLVTFQEWLRVQTLIPNPTVKEWVDAWNERLRFYDENYSVVYRGGACVHYLEFASILNKPPHLRKLSQWEMQAIFENWK